MPKRTLVSRILRSKYSLIKAEKNFKTLLCGALPDENCDDGGIPGDADDADQRNVHSQGINKPIRGGLDDVTVARPMRVQNRSAVINPRDRFG